MCGIAGQIVLERGAPDLAVVRAMTACLVHRGPDDEGLYADERVALGFRRLAIIDVAGGHQPMASADGAVNIVFNGEIYDHHERRRDLEARGAQFRTRSDTEVLIHGFREWGSALPEKVNGMFSFAVWDRVRGEALLARDRLGKKSIYYVRHAGSLWFASEIKALLAVPGWAREVDLEALDAFLAQQFVPAPLTIWRNVRALEPGQRMRIRGAQVEIDDYWRPRFEPKLDASDAELAEELARLCRAAVARRLESEVPLGAFLSGGLDSSIVVGLAARELGQPLRTFTIGFEEKGFDEREDARVVAEHFATEHVEHVVRPDVVRDFERILAQYDQPFADPSAIPTWYVSREARREVTVALTGDGGDDVFAGYGRYALRGLDRAWAAAPAGVRSSFERAMLRGLVSSSSSANLRPLARALQRRALSHLRSVAIPSYFSGADKRRVYRPEVAESLAGRGVEPLLVELHRATASLPEPLDRMLAVDLRQYLPGDLLVKLDIASMACSLEARSPLLDVEVVEFGLRLPDRVRVRDGVGKWLLRRAFESFLPPGVAGRKKHGFAVPVAQWLRGELAPTARELLFGRESGLDEFFDPREVQRLWDEHAAERRNHWGRLWALACFAVWRRATR
jgi:asparagine synthase (glutamine-hydrolysing)